MTFRSSFARFSVPAVGILVSVGLHGCGGGGTTTTTTPPPTPAPTTVTTTTTSVTSTTYTTPGQHDHEQAVVDELNRNYMNYDERKATGPFGVTVRFLAPNEESEKTWYYCGTPCVKGYADCRVSSAIINHRVMVKNNHIEKVLSMPIGVVFNQTSVEKKLAKCYYPYDGGTDTRYNMGCGCGAQPASASSNCSSPQCAYHSIDATTGKPMTSKSPEITRCHCKSVNDGSNCYWKGPAFFPDDSHNELDQMMQMRMSFQQAGPRTLDWDEVVIDGKVLTELLKEDASSAISAFIWMKTGDQAGDAKAYGQAKDLFNVMGGQYAFRYSPIVCLDMTTDVSRDGPFKVSSLAAPAYVV